MYLNQIIDNAIEAIKRNNGTCNFDYWKSYCDAYDEMIGTKYTWDLIVKSRISHECDKYKYGSIAK